jgi:hypothetical protein
MISGAYGRGIISKALTYREPVSSIFPSANDLNLRKIT